MLRQLNIVAHHFPTKTKNTIRTHIYNYLNTLIKESKRYPKKELRSQVVEDALVQLEDVLFTASLKNPQAGHLAMGFLNRAMEHRELKIQNGSHHLPMGLRLFILFATSCMIFSAFFVAYDSLFSSYVFTLIIGLLSYGIYLLIDDLDHPYQPGNWHLTLHAYKELAAEIKKKIF